VVRLPPERETGRNGARWRMSPGGTARSWRRGSGGTAQRHVGAVRSSVEEGWAHAALLVLKTTMVCGRGRDAGVEEGSMP
jgi:hypothetical protein